MTSLPVSVGVCLHVSAFSRLEQFFSYNFRGFLVRPFEFAIMVARDGFDD